VFCEENQGGNGVDETKETGFVGKLACGMRNEERKVVLRSMSRLARNDEWNIRQNLMKGRKK